MGTASPLCRAVLRRSLSRKMSPIFNTKSAPSNPNLDRTAQRISTMLKGGKDGTQVSRIEEASKEDEEYVPTPLSASPAAEGTRQARYNPFDETDPSKVLDLSLPNGPGANFKATEIRFHPTKTVGTGPIRIDSKKSNSVSSYDGFYIKSYAEGEDPDYRVDAKTGKRILRFCLSGKQSLLPELQRAAGILVLGSRIKPELTMHEIADMELNEEGYINICDPQSPVYCRRTCWFGKQQFALHVKNSTYTGASGNKTQYMVAVLERIKSEEAKKSSKSLDSTFYVDFPARKLACFYKSLSKIMLECGLKPLPIEQEIRDQIFQDLEDLGLEPDIAAVELVDSFNGVNGPVPLSITSLKKTLDFDEDYDNNSLLRVRKMIVEEKQPEQKRKRGADTAQKVPAPAAKKPKKVALPPKKRPLEEAAADTDGDTAERPSVLKRFKTMEMSSAELKRIQRALREEDEKMKGGNGDLITEPGDSPPASQHMLVDYEDSSEDEDGDEGEGERDALSTSFGQLKEKAAKRNSK